MRATAAADPRPVLWRVVLTLLGIAWLLVGTQDPSVALDAVAAGGVSLLVAGVACAVATTPRGTASMAILAGLVWLAPSVLEQLTTAPQVGALRLALWPLQLACLLAVISSFDRRDSVAPRWLVLVLAGSMVMALAVVVTWDPFLAATCDAGCPRGALVEPGPELRQVIRLALIAANLMVAVALMGISARSLTLRPLAVDRAVTAAGATIVGSMGILLAVAQLTRFDPIGRLMPGWWSIAVSIASPAVALPAVALGALTTATGVLVLAARRAVTRRRLRLLTSTPVQALDGGVGRALAAALGDRGIRIAYVVGEGEELVDADGRMASPVSGVELATRLELSGRPVAVIMHGSKLDPAALLDELEPGILVALDNERLRAARLNRLQELRASRERLVEVADAARRRIERDLHDGAQQRLLALAMELRLMAAEAERSGDPGLAAQWTGAQTIALVAIDELRRIAHGIYPAILAQAGLGPALRSLADETSSPLGLEMNLSGRMPSTVEGAAYAVVAELSTQVSDPGASIDIQVVRQGDQLLLDATGDLAAPSSLMERLRDRVGAAGGELTVEPQPGRGMRLHVELPCG